MKVESIIQHLIAQATSGQGDRPTGICPIRSRIVNVGTTSGRGSEVVEMFTCWKVDLYCLEGTRWRGGLTRLVKGKDNTYKFF